MALINDIETVDALADFVVVDQMSGFMAVRPFDGKHVVPSRNDLTGRLVVTLLKAQGPTVALRVEKDGVAHCEGLERQAVHDEAPMSARTRRILH